MPFLNTVLEMCVYIGRGKLVRVVTICVGGLALGVGAWLPCIVADGGRN